MVDLNHVSNSEREKNNFEEINHPDIDSSEDVGSTDERTSSMNNNKENCPNDQQVTSPTDENQTDDVDEGYFDSSFVDSSECLDAPVRKCTHGSIKEAKTLTDMLYLLSKEIHSNLHVSDFELQPKRRKVDTSCQTNESSMLLHEINRHKVENEAMNKKLTELSKTCSSLDSERLSLLMQTEELQKECVKRMSDNDHLQLKIDQKDCQITSLKETLLFRYKEVEVFQKKEKSPAILKSIHDFRELEMLKVDNIKLIHDNRALTTSLDSLTGQLNALRRITRNHPECQGSLELMNERLAVDNNSLHQSLKAVKKEITVLGQEHQAKSKEITLLRNGLKRSASDAIEPSHSPCSSSNSSSNSSLHSSSHSESGHITDENHSLTKENTVLRQSTSFLQEKVDSLNHQLKNIRSIHNAFNKALVEKSDLQKQLKDVEARNADLWSRVMSLSSRDYDDHVINNAASATRHLTSGSSHVISEGHVVPDKSPAVMTGRIRILEHRLDTEAERNAQMTQKIDQLTGSLSDAEINIQELETTVEFLQEEHKLVQEDLGRKVEDLQKTKEDRLATCKAKLRDKTRMLNACRIKLGHALLEIRELKSQTKNT